MEAEPLLTSPTPTTTIPHHPHLQQPLLLHPSPSPSPSPSPTPDFSFNSHHPLSNYRTISLPPPFLPDVEEDPPSLFIPHHHSAGPSQLVVGSQDAVTTNTNTNKKNKIHRCKTAPAMAIMSELLKNPQPQLNNPEPPQSASASLVRQAALLLILYLTMGILIYSFNRDHFSGDETHPVVDALYFCIVTMCTIGYGDIAPLSPQAKLFCCCFVLVGFGFIDILLSGVVNYVLDLQEKIILQGIQQQKEADHNPSSGGSYSLEKEKEKEKNNYILSARSYIFDFGKGRMRIRLKVGVALGAVVLSIGIGTVVLYVVEELDWIDSVYLSVMSVTTVGYGDRAFKSVGGRLFASVWLLFSTLAVARAFLYLAEARMDKRHRRMNKWVLQRQITVDDWLAADINHNGFISKSEYVIFKLKEMGKIGEKDVLEICSKFNKLDVNNSGKITLGRGRLA